MKPGDKFGKLLVLSEVADSNPKKWACRCDCGVTKNIRQDHLISGASRACGCQRRNAHRHLITSVVESPRWC